MIRRPPRSTQSRSSAASDVYKRQCTKCGGTFATPRSHCMTCGAETEWMQLPLTGKVHTYTTCYFGGQEFLAETPFTLIMVEWPGVDTLFLSVSYTHLRAHETRHDLV